MVDPVVVVAADLLGEHGLSERLNLPASPHRSVVASASSERPAPRTRQHIRHLLTMKWPVPLKRGEPVKFRRAFVGLAGALTGHSR